jgi:hypothetical protein
VEAARGAGRELRAGLALLHRLGDPEVEHLGHDARGGSGEEDVGRLDVSVRDPEAVREGEGAHDRHHDA